MVKRNPRLSSVAEDFFCTGEVTYTIIAVRRKMPCEGYKWIQINMK